MSSLLAVESGMGGQGLVDARIGTIPNDYHERLRADHGRVAVSSEKKTRHQPTKTWLSYSVHKYPTRRAIPRNECMHIYLPLRPTQRLGFV